MRGRNSGFTLVELMIAVAIVGILTAIAYPNYTDYVKRTHRSEIAGVLSEQVQNMERYYSKNGFYTNAPVTGTNTWYTVSSVINAQDFTLTATPIATAMMNGDKCGSFVINNTGARSNTGMATGITSVYCWGR